MILKMTQFEVSYSAFGNQMWCQKFMLHLICSNAQVQMVCSDLMEDQSWMKNISNEFWKSETGAIVNDRCPFK